MIAGNRKPLADPPSAPPPVARPLDDLVLAHIGLAHAIARRYTNRGESYDDLVQVAFVGLVKAAGRFDATRGVQFSTFATAGITGELKRHFRDKRWGMRVPRSLQERYLRVRAATDALVQTLGRSPTVTEIAVEAGVSDDAVVEAQELASVFHLTSIETATASGEGDGVAAGGLPSIDDGLRIAGVDNRSVLVPLLRRLPEREQRILMLRFGENLSQSQIALRLGISQMQVSRLLARALANLRGWLQAEAP